jgi:hypothetical protein
MFGIGRAIDKASEEAADAILKFVKARGGEFLKSLKQSGAKKRSALLPESVKTEFDQAVKRSVTAMGGTSHGFGRWGGDKLSVSFLSVDDLWKTVSTTDWAKVALGSVQGREQFEAVTKAVGSEQKYNELVGNVFKAVFPEMLAELVGEYLGSDGFGRKLVTKPMDLKVYESPVSSKTATAKVIFFVSGKREEVANDYKIVKKLLLKGDTFIYPAEGPFFR